MKVGSKLWLTSAADGTETLLELVDPALGVHELSQPSEEGVGIGSDADGNHAVFDTINGLLLVGSLGGTGDETLAGRHVDKHDWLIIGMNLCFHRGNGVVPTRYRRAGAARFAIFGALSSEQPYK